MGSAFRFLFLLQVEPMVGIEPTTYGLRNRCSTTELHWLANSIRADRNILRRRLKVARKFPFATASVFAFLAPAVQDEPRFAHRKGVLARENKPRPCAIRADPFRGEIAMLARTDIPLLHKE